MKTEKPKLVCANCDNEGWVCEEHPEVPWTSYSDCCGGAGMPCTCNILYWKNICLSLEARIAELEESKLSTEYQALGWMYAELCNRVDRGDNILGLEVPELIETYKRRDQLVQPSLCSYFVLLSKNNKHGSADNKIRRFTDKIKEQE